MIEHQIHFDAQFQTQIDSFPDPLHLAACLE